MEEINEKLHMDLILFDESRRKQWMQERKPFSALVELTACCNFNCIHCYLQENHKIQQMSTQDVKYIIDILYEKGILFLTFTGGEILTRRDFLEIYLYAKKRGFLVELFSNGFLFTDEIIRTLSQYPPLLVDISLYGADEETYRRFTGVNNAFERVIYNVQSLKNAGVRVSLKTPVIRMTYTQIDRMRELAEDIGVPFVYTFEICPTIERNVSPQKLAVTWKEVLYHEFSHYFDQIQRGQRQEGKVNDE